MSTSFDTLKLAKGLEGAGMPQDQAVKTAEVFAETMNDGLSTKSDLRELETRIMGEIRLVKWMLALVIAATVIPLIRDLL